jgi:serine/threonine-protein kinase HipA
MDSGSRKGRPPSLLKLRGVGEIYNKLRRCNALVVARAARVGSLRFSDENGVLQRAVEPGQRSVPPLVELKDLVAASHAVERNTETAADLRYLLGKGTSVGGLRPKASVLDDDGALCIGKFPSVKDDRPIEKGEVLALRLAALAGIDAAQARVVDADGESVALVRRFDRTREGRLLYVSARTLMGVDDDQEHTYTEIAETIRMRGNEVAKDLAQLWRRIVYSVLITNVDDHLNNHGFLHVSRGKWRLSPAFDLNPFPDKDRALKTWIERAVVTVVG